MKLIIDIDKDAYEEIKKIVANKNEMCFMQKSIANGIPLDVIKAENLCNSCTNMACEFQYGIERSSCAFYMPPNTETDNCGNYIFNIDKHIGGCE